METYSFATIEIHPGAINQKRYDPFLYFKTQPLSTLKKKGQVEESKRVSILIDSFEWSLQFNGISTGYRYGFFLN